MRPVQIVDLWLKIVLIFLYGTLLAQPRGAYLQRVSNSQCRNAYFIIIPKLKYILSLFLKCNENYLIFQRHKGENRETVAKIKIVFKFRNLESHFLHISLLKSQK